MQTTNRKEYSVTVNIFIFLTLICIVGITRIIMVQMTDTNRFESIDIIDEVKYDSNADMAATILKVKNTIEKYYNINVYYETKNGVELLIDYNKENKLDKIILTAQIDTTKMGYKLTDEYLMTKTFLLKTKELNINEEDFNTLSECTKGIEPKACTTDKITVKEANEATSYIPRFVILINN